LLLEWSERSTTPVSAVPAHRHIAEEQGENLGLCRNNCVSVIQKSKKRLHIFNIRL
jgi:hypothetical protein